MAATPTPWTSEFSMTLMPCQALRYSSKRATARKQVLTVHLKDVVTSTIQSTILVLYSLLILCLARGDTLTLSPATKFLCISVNRVRSKSSPLSGVECSVLTKLQDRLAGSIEPPLIFVTLILYRSVLFDVLTPLRLEAWPEIIPSAGMLLTLYALLSLHSSAAMFSVPQVARRCSEVLRDYEVLYVLGSYKVS